MLRKVFTAGLTLLAIGVAAIPAIAAPPNGPRLGVMKLIHDPPGLELATLGPSGGSYRQILMLQLRRRFDVLGIPAWSADGTALAFSRRHGGRRAIWVVPADGGRPRVVPGTNGGEWPVFSADGRGLAFSRYRAKSAGRIPTYRSSSVWIVDLASGTPRQLTRWRNELWQYPSSFSPDGSTLLLNRLDYRRSGDNEVVAQRFDGRTSGLLIGEGSDPVYSPDGSKIVLAREYERRVGRTKEKGWGTSWKIQTTADLFVVDADGSHLRRLTRTPGKTEMFGSWDPSGERIAYSQFQGYPFARGSRGAIMAINIDGTCPTTIRVRDGVSYFSPIWQPGPDREAGRLAC